MILIYLARVRYNIVSNRKELAMQHEKTVLHGGILRDCFEKVRRNFYERIDAEKHARVYEGLFPEGYANKAGELQPLRNGSLKVAIKSQAPIVVCVLDNTPQIQKNMFRRKTVVDFRVLDIISPESFEDMNTAQLGEIIHTQMQNALDDIRNKK